MQQVGKAAHTYGIPVLHSGCCPNNLTKQRRIRRRWIVPNLSRWLTGLPGSVRVCGHANVHVVTGVGQWTGVRRYKILTAIRVYSPLLLAVMKQAAPLKQHKSRDADWLKNISSSKRSELLECELKKMTTVIASECTAL